ncbi:antA/AntB antirepressor family protein [Pelomicrobium methylotrophicum]|uniref:AntA/AntB antirepressor domain-containing protein n=1 Tax=Pelomicrobium methylotrophicum TaxID=2602750 RepID=A0A5C7EVU2_9PROT|nr:antA/AntB antirepressor family protein [Pelomicrobium methylotrophicum]TXF11185.1 hypothetical protein FR698_11765 [Pelomicrobium methylotrophicum]
MAEQLVPVKEGRIGNAKTLVVDARDLHAALGVGKDFTSWIKLRIRQYGFEQNRDYLLTQTGEQLHSGTKWRSDYFLSLDMAKELAMVERNEKGRAVRKYFIECERRAHQAAQAHLLLEGKTMDGLWLWEGKPAGAICLVRESTSLDTGYIVAIQRPDGILSLIGTRRPADFLAREADTQRDSVALVSRPLENYAQYRRLAFGILAERFPKEYRYRLKGATLDDVKAVLESLLAGGSHAARPATSGAVDRLDAVVLDDDAGIEVVQYIIARYRKLQQIVPEPLEANQFVAGGALALLWGMLKQEFGARGTGRGGGDRHVH